MLDIVLSTVDSTVVYKNDDCLVKLDSFYPAITICIKFKSICNNLLNQIESFYDNKNSNLKSMYHL